MELVVDADGHVLEPPDVWARHIDPAWRDRAVRVARGADGRDALLVDGRPARLTTSEMLGGFGCMGKSLAELATACLSGRYAENAPAAATDPAARLRLLDADGITHAVLYPSLGLQWEAELADGAAALANCRAYNRWIEGFCADGGGRLVPVAHLALGDATAAADELRRAVRAGARGGFLLPFTHDGRAHGHPDHDPLWAAACELDVPIAIHTGMDPLPRDMYRRFDDLRWPDSVPQGSWYMQLMFAQAVQQAFSTFLAYGTLDRFPSLKLVLLESGAGWLAWWMDRMDGMASGSLGVVLPLRDRPSSYVRRQCWISADPDEHGLPAVLELVGADRFLWATDYPHSDHDARYMTELRELADRLAPAARRALVGETAARLYGIPAA